MKVLIGISFALVCLTGCQSLDSTSSEESVQKDFSSVKAPTNYEKETSYLQVATEDLLPKKLYEEYKDVKIAFNLKESNTTRGETLKIDGQEVPRISVEVWKSDKLENTHELAKTLHTLINNEFPELSKGVFIHDEANDDKTLPKDLIVINLGDSYNSFKEKQAALEVVTQTLENM